MRGKCLIKGIEIAAVDVQDDVPGRDGGALHRTADATRRTCDQKPHLTN